VELETQNSVVNIGNANCGAGFFDNCHANLWRIWRRHMTDLWLSAMVRQLPSITLTQNYFLLFAIN